MPKFIGLILVISTTLAKTIRVFFQQRVLLISHLAYLVAV